MNREAGDHIRRKDAYHHGDLREALIQAARQLVEECGAEHFSLADACRLAGVSTAAPYKHFRDKDEILKALVLNGFDRLSALIHAAVAKGGADTLAGITAMGHAYLQFAQLETGIFRLMFSQSPKLKADGEIQSQGRACFGSVIEHIGVFCKANGVEANSQQIALELWTFVHGAASLVIDGDYQKVAPGLDVGNLITLATPKLLGLTR